MAGNGPRAGSWDKTAPSFAVALNCGIGSSSLNAEVNALESSRSSVIGIPRILARSRGHARCGQGVSALREGVAHRLPDHTIDTAAHKHAAGFDVDGTHGVAEQHDCEDEPGGSLADDLLGVSIRVEGGRSEIGKDDGGGAPEGDEAENHRRRDEHRNLRTLGLRLGLESSGFGSIRVVPEHLNRQRTGDPSLLRSHDNGDPASVAAAAKAVHPMFQSAASCQFSTLPKIPSALSKTLFLDRVSFLREPTISGNLPWLAPGDVDHQSKDRNRKQRDGGEKAQLFPPWHAAFLPVTQFRSIDYANSI